MMVEAPPEAPPVSRPPPGLSLPNEVSEAAQWLTAGAGDASEDAGGAAPATQELSAQQRAQLRSRFVDAETGATVPYHVGRLKSFSQKNGYGFLECPEVYRKWGSDAFIYKRLLPQPWSLNQLVEFAVVLNKRGQPQAADVRWLPRPGDEEGEAVTIEGTGNPEKPGLDSGGVSTELVVRQVERELENRDQRHGAGSLRHLGVLKSFSPAQGYGFIASEQLFAAHGRDIYFDRSQLPTARWALGQTVEFTVTLNAHGQPQARRVDWDPVPMLIPQRAALPMRDNNNKRVILELSKLLQSLALGQAADAMQAAVDLQGQQEQESPGVEFVTFVLDRLPHPELAARETSGALQLRLLLLVARILRRPQRQRLVPWFDALARSLNPLAVEEKFHEAVAEIVRGSSVESMGHLAAMDPVAFGVFFSAVQVLQAKGRFLALKGAGRAAAM